MIRYDLTTGERVQPTSAHGRTIQPRVGPQFVFFDRGTIALGEARELVDELSDGVPVIRNERDVVG